MQNEQNRSNKPIDIPLALGLMGVGGCLVVGVCGALLTTSEVGMLAHKYYDCLVDPNTRACVNAFASNPIYFTILKELSNITKPFVDALSNLK